MQIWQVDTRSRTTAASLRALNWRKLLLTSENRPFLLTGVPAVLVGEMAGRKILHVATGLTPIGGITAFISRWIRQDVDRSHSFVLTRQVREEVPRKVYEAITNNGGRVYRLNGAAGSITDWARRLRKISGGADAVVLHTSTHDVIPLLAFANKDGCPPIIYVNHADHVLSLGVSISNVFANLRQSGMELSRERRGVVAERNALLPTLIADVHRTRQRIEAKRQLGVPDDSIVLVSVARKLKFRSINNESYAGAHVALLEKHKNAILITVGSGVQEGWSDAILRVQGRIIALPEQDNPSLYFEAADIYVDLFPFVSNTSLLEAGSYGLPLVSRYPFPLGCEVLGADMPGFSDTLIRVENAYGYTAVLSRLIEDENYRLNLGEATRVKISETHMGMNWQRSVENLYERASACPMNDILVPAMDEMHIEDLDMLTPYVHNVMSDGRTRTLQELHDARLRIMPFRDCIHYWRRTAEGINGRRWLDRLLYIVPEWLLCQTRPLWKRMPFARAGK